MNIVVGMINPEMNWAPKLAWYSCSFSASKRSWTSRCRPNTLTRECPLNASSICPLSRPVCAHWAMNLRFERLAIWRVTTITSGIVTRASDASNGEIEIIIATTPMTVNVEISSWLSVCCMLCWMLSMSLVARLRISPRGRRSK